MVKRHLDLADLKVLAWKMRDRLFGFYCNHPENSLKAVYISRAMDAIECVAYNLNMRIYGKFTDSLLMAILVSLAEDYEEQIIDLEGYGSDATAEKIIAHVYRWFIARI